MKKLFFTAILIPVAISCLAQQATVKLKVIGAKTPKIAVQLPVDGSSFYPGGGERMLDKDSCLVLSFPVEKAARISLGIEHRGFRFYVESGQTNITLDLHQKDTAAIQYDGPSSAGQLLLNARKYTFYQDKAERYLKKDSTAQGVMALIKADEDQEMRPYDEFLKQGKITANFYEQIKYEISVHYAAVASNVPALLYFDGVRAKKTVPLKKEFHDMWAMVYAARPVQDAGARNATDFFDYAHDYAEFYQLFYLARLNGRPTIPKNMEANEVLNLRYANLENQFTGKVKAYVLASFLHRETIQKKYQKSLVTLYEKFKKTYPNSEFTAPLKAELDEVADYQVRIKKDFEKDQKIMVDYDKINTLSELAANFKGKTVFVDLWATWCGPCKSEFEYNAPLEAYLKLKGVEMLFISMDKESAEQQWKEMIKFYKLSGTHVRTNPALQKDLVSILWAGKGYAIPRYLILKDGKVVVPDAFRPSDKEKLYQQIDLYL